MKNIFLSAIATLAIFNGCASAAQNDSEIIEKIRALPVAKSHQFIPQELKDGGSMYFAKGYFDTPRGKQSASMFVSSDFKTIVYGKAFDALSGEEYTPFSIKEMKENAAFTYGSGNQEYFLVIDPLCPACVGFEKTLPQYEAEVRIHFIFLPLTNIHPTAPQAVSYILSGKDDKEKFERLQAIALGDKKYLDAKVTSENIAKMDMQIKLSNELGTKGTPTLYTETGREVSRAVLEYRHSQLAQNQQSVEPKK